MFLPGVEQDSGTTVQHIRSRTSSDDENTHEIYLEVVSSSHDAVKQLKDSISSDVIVHVTMQVPVDSMTSSPVDSRPVSVRHNVALDRTDTQCKSLARITV